MKIALFIVRGADEGYMIPGSAVLTWADGIANGTKLPYDRYGKSGTSAEDALVMKTPGDWLTQPGAKKTTEGITYFNIGGQILKRYDKEKGYINSDGYVRLSNRPVHEGPEYPEMAKFLNSVRAGATDSQIAFWVRRCLKGEGITAPPALADAVALMALMLFGAETWRNKRAFLCNLMYLDLVEFEISYGRQGKRYGWTRGMDIDHDSSSNPRDAERTKERRGQRQNFGKIPAAGGKSASKGKTILPDDDRYYQQWHRGREMHVAQVQQKELSVILSWLTAFTTDYSNVTDREVWKVELAKDKSVNAALNSFGYGFLNPGKIGTHEAAVKEKLDWRFTHFDAPAAPIRNSVAGYP